MFGYNMLIRPPLAPVFPHAILLQLWISPPAILLLAAQIQPDTCAEVNMRMAQLAWHPQRDWATKRWGSSHYKISYPRGTSPASEWAQLWRLSTEDQATCEWPMPVTQRVLNKQSFLWCWKGDTGDQADQVLAKQPLYFRLVMCQCSGSCVVTSLACTLA